MASTQKITDNICDNKLNLRDHSISVTENQLAHFKNIREGFIDSLVAEIERRFPLKDTSVINAFSVLALKGINHVSSEDLEKFRSEKKKILSTFYGASSEETTESEEGKEEETMEPVVNIEETKSEWALLKHLVKEHMYPNESISGLWQILYKHHKDNFPNLFKLASGAYYSITNC